MKHYWALLGVLFVFTFSGFLGADAPAVKTRQVQLNGHTFTLPLGFEIELVAGPPLVQRPITADFDEEGRLYVADSAGSNDKVEKQLRDKPHRILRLEDTDGDGRFDKSVVFAARMMLPQGTMWYAGSLYVAAPPSIWKLTDSDGDGQADQRIEWFQGKTLTGCANDLHGPYLGPDGWIYWCKGAFARQTYARPGRPPFVTRAAHIFRCRPDGSGVEPVMTGGMDNPVDVAFTPDGERILTTTFFQHPGGGRRDGLIHAVHGGVYGKDHDPIHEHPWTGPSLMPVLTHLGPAAPSGLTRSESFVFGPNYLFAALFNLQKVTRHRLQPSGATFQTLDEDFLVSSNRDFHPTDVLEDADGSLLVVDTGGWYKLCCPTSQLVKPDVLGGIYRIRYPNVLHFDDPRGRKLAWATMPAEERAKLLDDVRPAVRRRAVESLAALGDDALPALAATQRAARHPDARRNAVWAATRIDRARARALVRSALTDADESVRQAALHSVSVWRDREALPALLQLLKGPSARNQRVAAEALGRIGDRSAVPALLEAASRPADRALEHSRTFALIEIADKEGTAAGLRSADLRIRRTAMIALDQMGGALDPEAVAAELASADPALKDTAAWIVGRHPEWGPALAGFFRERLTAKNLSKEDELARQLSRLARAPAIQQLLAERLADPTASREVRRVALKAMAQSGLKQIPENWLDALAQVLNGADPEMVRAAVAAARAFPVAKKPSEKLLTGLLHVANNPQCPASVRLQALAAAPGGLREVPAPLFTLLLTHLDRNQPAPDRALAAEVLAQTRLTSEQLLTLTESLKSAAPTEINRVLEAFGHAPDDKVGQCLIAALKEAPAQSAVRVESLKPRLVKYGPKVQEQAEQLYRALNADAVQQKARLEQALRDLVSGDARRGQAVFNSPRAACASCHAVGYLGGTIGPDLTRVGQIRGERDLLEAILFPSASLVQGYDPVVITTRDGKIFNGLIRKNSPEEIVLATGVNQEVRLQRQDIDDMEPGKVSLMPAGLDKQLTPQELADLMAFLKACK